MPEIPALSTSRSLIERVRRTFAEDGPLAIAFDGFEPRACQEQLATAVATAFSDGGTLVAEAGTGTGKTLAYLVPAVLEGRRVLISTGTRTLQDQIFYKDVPALARALDIEIRAAYMKGRTNYLCRHRFDRLNEASAGLTFSEREWLERIAEWAEDTTTGDRSEVDDLPDDFPMWMELSATREQCLGHDCPQYSECFITKMRDRAAEANLVIVNHHLLCADASVRQGDYGEVIPACELAVIDEAHQLEDIVTQYFGVSVSTYRLDDFVRDATRAIETSSEPGSSPGTLLVEALRTVANGGRALMDAAKLELRLAGSGDRVVLTADAIARLETCGVHLSDALSRFASLLKRDADAPGDLAGIAARAETLRQETETVLRAADERFVHFIEARGRSIFLRAAPIDVADIVRDTVVGSRAATILTSATLTVESKFDYLLGRLGLADATTLRLPSEFDFRTQAVLYLPKDMPDPRSPEFNREAARVIAALLAKTRGRAFVLFTSYAAMRDVREILGESLRWPLLMQGTSPRSALLREFRATPHAVLFATSSFWQGVDVAGDALSCVIVDRLPFASPSDPLVAARIASINGRGGNAFQEYQVPLAALTLLQGLGRLIRSKTDRGVLAVLDPRLIRMPYGRRFLASLPPSPITDDLGMIERFLDGDSEPSEPPQ